MKKTLFLVLENDRNGLTSSSTNEGEEIEKLLRAVADTAQTSPWLSLSNTLRHPTSP